MDFSFATPVPEGAKTAGEGIAGGLFDRWLDQTEKLQPSPQLLKARQLCTEENVDVLAVSDRYEGHTADLLFTKWLSTTEAALSPEPQAPGAVATPGVLAPAVGTQGTPGGATPLSALRNASAAACGRSRTEDDSRSHLALSPLTRCDFNYWQDSDAEDSPRRGDTELSDQGHVTDRKNIPEQQQQGRRQTVTDAGSDLTDAFGDLEVDLLPQLSAMTVSARRAPKTPGMSMAGDDMAISPWPAARAQQQQYADATEEVLALMVTPEPLQASAAAAGALPAAKYGASLPLSWDLDTQATKMAQATTDAAAGVLHVGQYDEEDHSVYDDESSGDEFDLDQYPGLGTPLSVAMMSPVQEVIGLMMGPF